MIHVCICRFRTESVQEIHTITSAKQEYWYVPGIAEQILSGISMNIHDKSRIL